MLLLSVKVVTNLSVPFPIPPDIVSEVIFCTLYNVETLPALRTLLGRLHGTGKPRAAVLAPSQLERGPWRVGLPAARRA